MSSTLFLPIAEIIAGAGDQVDLVKKAYARDPGMAGMTQLPALVVGFPTLRRQGVEEPESEVGSNDWRLSYPVSLFFDLHKAEVTAERILEALEQLVEAIDNPDTWEADQSIIDWALTVAEPVEILDESRSLMSYECRVELLKLVAAA